MRIIQSLHSTAFLSELLNLLLLYGFRLSKHQWIGIIIDPTGRTLSLTHHTLLEYLNPKGTKVQHPDPIDDLPECLNLKSKIIFHSDREWQEYLDSDSGNGITTREMYLRVLLVYAVSDQGADIPGVRLFMNHFIKECYSKGVRLFEARPMMGDPVMIRIAFEGANIAFEKRSETWAREGKRNASTYSVFTVDGIPGKPSANWYVNSRIAPALSIAHQVEGGLTEILSNHSNPQFQKSWETVKKTIRQDVVHGLFQAIGDKAIHLYMKWVFGTFRNYSKRCLNSCR